MNFALYAPKIINLLLFIFSTCHQNRYLFIVVSRDNQQHIVSMIYYNSSVDGNPVKMKGIGLLYSNRS